MGDEYRDRVAPKAESRCPYGHDRQESACRPARAARARPGRLRDRVQVPAVQQSSGTTDEKIPYALADLDAMWIEGALVYGGTGWSSGVLHTLQAAQRAVRCDPPAGF